MRGSVRFMAAAGLVAALAPAASASELGAADRLARARVCYAALDYACAGAELEAARASLGDLATGERVEVLRLSAEVALVDEDRAAALTHLQALLVVAPDFAPPEGAWPAPWLEALAEARAAAPDRAPPAVSVTPPASAAAGRPLEVVARVDDDGAVARVTLYVATAAGPPVALAMATSDGELWRAAVPAELVKASEVAVWIEAFDRAGNGPGAWASAAAPARIPVAPAPIADDAAFYETWWFWTAVGAVAVGGGVALALWAADGDDGASPGRPEVGNISVTVEPPR